MPAVAAAGRVVTGGPVIQAGASVVAIGERAVMIEGPSGSGKSSLALALIDRGALLIGDDAVTLKRTDEQVIASAPPNIAGLLELRGVGLIERPIAAPTPLAMVLSLGGEPGERLPEAVPTRDVLGLPIPCLAFEPGTIAPALRAECALAEHGLEFASLVPEKPRN